VRFNNAALARWFLYFLYSQEASGKLRQYFTGTGIQHFTGASLSRLVLPIPPSKKVDVFVEGFDAVALEVSHLENIYQRKITALEELKKSLLHQAFSGQL
jgi:type I restriction enzyme S subunit